MTPATFQPGTTYQAHFSHGISGEIRELVCTRRTDKSVWFRIDGCEEFRAVLKETRGSGVEFCSPFGQTRLYAN